MGDPKHPGLRYGIIRVWRGDGTATMETAHRVAYRLAVGEIPAGLLVRHGCDNPICVNPRHLLLGTQADNARDMVRRKRNWSSRGERNWQAVLTDAQVAEARNLYALGGIRQADLAARYGCTQSHISSIVSGRSRRYADGPTMVGDQRVRLTDAQVTEIRRRHAAGVRQLDLVKEFGVSKSTISAIVRGQSRQHVEPTTT